MSATHKTLFFVLFCCCLASCDERNSYSLKWYESEIQPIECHVRFVDQDGKPIANASVNVAVMTRKPDATPEKPRDIQGYKTDEGGNFHLVGERGGALWMKISDQIYLHGSISIGSIGGTILRYTKNSSDGNRNYGSIEKPAVICVWRKEGPQPLVSLKNEIVVPFDGKAFRLDLAKGCLVDDGGDLLIEPEMPTTDAARREKADSSTSSR